MILTLIPSLFITVQNEYVFECNCILFKLDFITVRKTFCPLIIYAISCKHIVINHVFSLCANIYKGNTKRLTHH